MTAKNFLVMLGWAFLLSAPIILLMLVSIDTPSETQHFVEICDTMHGTVGKVDNRIACVDVVFYKAEKL